VQRIAAVGGSEARPAMGVGAPVDARIVPVTAGGSAWRLFGSVMVDGGMAMHAGAVIVVVDIDVPMSAEVVVLAMAVGTPVGTAVAVVPMNEQRVPGIGSIARVGMRMVEAVPETHRVRMGVGAVPVGVAMLNQA
jgi:hypothetical protein